MSDLSGLDNSFYSALWGNSSSFRSVWYGAKSKPPTQHKWFVSTTDALEFVTTLDKNKFNIYHACSLFDKQSRKKQDVACAKAVWLDLDLKGTTFTSQSELLMQLKLFKGTLFEPLPWIVSSGNGFHVYWIFNNFLLLEEWEIISNKLYALAQEKGIQVDHTRTRDAASILRCPNTYNLKDNSKLVTIISQGKLLEKSRFITETAKIKYDKNDFNLNNTLQQLNFLKSDINNVAEKCAFIEEFKKTGHHDNEPAWHFSLSIARLCVDGIEYAHQFSAQDSAYKQRETDYKLNNLITKDIGPALCTTLEQFGYCKNCPHKGKIKSPIQLGLVTTPIKNICEGLEDKKEKDRAKELIALAPTVDWVVGQEGIYRIVEETLVLVCIVPFYIVDLLCEDFNDETLITAVIRAYRGKNIETFKLPLRYVAEDRKLLAEFNGRRIFPANKKFLKEYIATYIMRMNKIDPQRSIVSLGWQKNDSFVYNSAGDCISKNGDFINCVLDHKMVGYASGFEKKGKLDEWVKGIELLKGDVFQPHLFSVFCSFGAPLLAYTSAKGFVLSLQGSSGSGKTLAHKYALSVWGNPDVAGCLGTYDTHKAVLGRLAVAKNLPLRLDEATLLKPQQLNGLIYELVNGRGRSRATMDGSLANTASEWQTMTFMTTNRPILENDVAIVSEAERCRVLELTVDMPADIVSIGRRLGAIMETNYGIAGKVFIKYLILHKQYAIDLLNEYQTQLQQFAEDDKRFWVTCGATALVAAQLLNDMQMIDIKLETLKDWFTQTLKTQCINNENNIVAARGFKTREEFIHALYDSLGGCLLVLNPNFVTIEKPNREIKGRVVQISDRESFLYTSAPVIREFIKKHFVASYEKVLEDFQIELTKVRRFGLATVRCHEFKL